MARKGLLERKVEGAISPTQKFEADASINIVKPENRSIYNTSVELFQEEYNIIKPKTIICFGDKVEKFLTDMIKNEELTVDSNVEIIKIKHYSAQLSYECLKKESDKLR